MSLDADILVIGSGFGGAVSALRLAEKGYRVTVLEQGKRYRTEDFPRTNWALREYLWMPRLGLSGIQVLTFLRHALVLHGRGVGGGSLVYANTLVQPDGEVLRRPGWGGDDWGERLAPHFAQARRMLGATPCPGIGHADALLREIGTDLRGEDTFRIHDVGVFFGESEASVPDPYFGGDGPDRTGCTRCGACMIGCRVGAKNTLDKNYLWLAERQGVRIVPETEALEIHKVDEGYVVHTRHSLGLRRHRRSWRARQVVVSGGVIGTVKLLLRSKARGGLPDLSRQVGRYVRTNSESILAADSDGSGAALDDHIAITSGIRADARTHIEVVRFNRGSDALFWLTVPLGGEESGSRRIVRGLWRGLWGGLWPFGRAERTAIVLAMQASEGTLELDYRSGRFGWMRPRLRSRLPAGQAPPVAKIPIAREVARRLARALGGRAWGTWPEVLLGAPTTAHILGGCRIGTGPDSGAVDARGEVFGYPGLFVVDGSVVPVNLGVNPSLTITALAEYIMDQFPERADAVPRS